MKRDYDHLFKLVLIGDSGVGKSCLLLRFADDQFTESYITTIGVDFRFKTIQVPDGGGPGGKGPAAAAAGPDAGGAVVAASGGDHPRNRTIKLQIWDTAGQERFRTITSAYYRGADGIVIVYDATDRESFGHVEDWVEEVNKYANVSTAKILIANKKDAPDPKVTPEEGRAKAAKLGINFMETSAKTGDGVEESFKLVSSALIRLRQQQQAAGDGAGDRGGGGQRVQLGGGGTGGGGGQQFGQGCCSG